MNRINQRISYFLAYFLMGCGVVLFLAFGLFHWPGLHWDGALYTTPALNLANGYGWRFGSYTQQLLERNSDEYSIHGVLYPIVFGLILKSSNYESLIFWSGTINAVTFLLHIYLFHHYYTPEKYEPKELFSVIFGFFTGFICLNLQGRPEHLAPLLISLPLVVKTNFESGRAFRYSAYLVNGLMFLLSPILGIIYGMSLIFWRFRNEKDIERDNQKSLVQEIFIAISLSGGTIVFLIEVFCSFSTSTWFQNTFLSREQVPKYIETLLTFNIYGLEHPGWTILVLITCVFIVKNLWSHNRCLVLLILICAGLYIYPYLRGYWCIPFFPVFILMMLGKENKWLKSGYIVKRFLKLFSIGFATLYSFLLFRLMLLFLLYLNQGRSLGDAKQITDELLSNLDQRSEAIAFLWLTRPSLVSLSYSPNFFLTAETSLRDTGLDPFLGEYEIKFGKRVKYILLPELGHIRELPKKMSFEGRTYILTYNGWSQKRANFIKLKLGGAIPGYHFAVYQDVNTLEGRLLR